MAVLGLVALVPPLLDALPLGAAGIAPAQLVRWTVPIAVVIVALAVVYRMTPDRDAPRIRWASSEVISGVDEHDGYLRFGWQMRAADGTVALEATGFGEFTAVERCVGVPALATSPRKRG